jgi:sensitive to high expression protein 9, mitochondrial
LTYEQAVHRRAQSQREVNDLLQRKSSWTDDDVGRFTALVRQDHLYEQAEARAKLAAESMESQVEQEFTELMRVILNRYHEEQVWSDKIRSASTYGSLAVLGLNMAVFVLAIVLVEPWKRKRLAQTFEKKVDEMTLEMIEAVKGQTKYMIEQQHNQEHEMTKLAEFIQDSLLHLPTLGDKVRQNMHEAGAEANHVSLVQDKYLWTLLASAASTGVLGLLVGYYLAI